MTDIDYLQIVEHYEDCLAKHGDTHQGVDWPNAQDALKRYEVMLGVVRSHPKQAVRILDFGCGAGHLLDYIRTQNISGIDYVGLDLSPQFISLCRQKYPDIPFYCKDILADEVSDLPQFDYVILNGVLTEKRGLPFDAMWTYTRTLLKKVFEFAQIGIVFNVMSKHVDWERDDLFHMPLDLLAGFLTKHLSRHYLIRNDYGLYEFATYVYKEPSWPKWSSLG
jgi:SAM-dependent methyltransferase